MSFILRWLGLTIERPTGISVRPSRTVEVELPYEAAYARCLSGLRDVAGANISSESAAGGTIEGTFGLINSERIACTVRRVDANRSEVTIESRRFAGAGLPKDSAVLERLELWIREGR
jgi:hypothetical protein